MSPDMVYFAAAERSISSTPNAGITGSRGSKQAIVITEQHVFLFLFYFLCVSFKLFHYLVSECFRTPCPVFF